MGVQVAGGRHDGRREACPTVLADQRRVVRLSVTQLLEIIFGRKSFNRWLVGERAGTSGREEDVVVSPLPLSAKSSNELQQAGVRVSPPLKSIKL